MNNEANNDDARDARRYRWLRSRDLGTVYSGGVFVGKTPDNLVLDFEDADRAIDEAMEAELRLGEKMARDLGLVGDVGIDSHT